MRTKNENTWHLLLYTQWLCNVKKFIKLTSNSTQTVRKHKKLRKTKKLVFQKNWWKMWTPINLSTHIEQNNDHTWIIHGIQFCSSLRLDLVFARQISSMWSLKIIQTQLVLNVFLLILTILTQQKFTYSNKTTTKKNTRQKCEICSTLINWHLQQQ